MKINVFRFVAAIAVCQLAGLLGSLFTAPNIPTWYASISKPAFTPPDWLFAPVWTVLFLLMGVALYFAWARGLERKGVRTALLVFGVQLILNVLWSLLFFGLQSPLYALVEIIILWLAVLATIVRFYGIERKAALLLVPYICWVGFAALLNYYVWMLNA
jgi:tryptophan-rich sensory protein